MDKATQINLIENNESDVETDTETNVFKKTSNVLKQYFTCGICMELLVQATTHTFCEFCINKWYQREKKCAICKKTITSRNRSLMINNFIESMIQNLPAEFKNKRKELVSKREGKKYFHILFNLCLIYIYSF